MYRTVATHPNQSIKVVVKNLVNSVILMHHRLSSTVSICFALQALKTEGYANILLQIQQKINELLGTEVPADQVCTATLSQHCNHCNNSDNTVHPDHEQTCDAHKLYAYRERAYGEMIQQGGFSMGAG